MTDDRQAPAPAPRGFWEQVAAAAERPARLSHVSIAQTAVRIADAEGLTAVTLRRVAAELGVTAMALYGYVDTKTDLLTLMTEEVFAEPSSVEGTTWRAVMRWYAHYWRDAMLSHPWVMQVPARPRVGLSPRTAAVLEVALSSLSDTDLDRDEAVAVVDTVAAYAQGRATAEAAQLLLAIESGLESLADLHGVLSADVHWLMTTGRYPTLAERLPGRPRHEDLDWRFDTGLDIVLDGIGTRFGI